MIELPESVIIVRQLKEFCLNQKVVEIELNQTPHAFAFYTKEPSKYQSMLMTNKVLDVFRYGSRIVIQFQDCSLHLWDGTKIHAIEENSIRPQKHQLRLVFEHTREIIVTIQMYGGIQLFHQADEEDYYYRVAKAKPDPFSSSFSMKYFDSLFTSDWMNQSLKAFLATKQNIPGFGNGILQDILYEAKLHPKKKVSSLSKEKKTHLFYTIKRVLVEMVEQHGRNTEKDIFGKVGNYNTLSSFYKDNEPCPKCQSFIQKESYMGGAIYYCNTCQPLNPIEK